LYIVTIGVVVLIVIIWIGFHFISRPATCFDKVQNQEEVGPDCGGPCALLCSNQAYAPIVLWTRAFETGPSTYTVAAYVKNPNVSKDAAAYNVHYAMRLFDENNLLVVERDGIMNIPPQDITPIVEANVSTGNRTIAHAFLEFSGKIQWITIPHHSLPQVQIKGQQFSLDGRTLSATVKNQGAGEVRNLNVSATLFDASGTAQAASRTLVERIGAASSQDIVFTWSTTTPNIVRAEIIPILSLPPL
ncbi:hypothetical protein D4R49_00005, partial [bacterium]